MESNETFVGWTPCVNGHLDFGLTQVVIKGGFSTDGFDDEHVIDENFSRSGVESKHDRAILLQSKVDWRDSVGYDKTSGHFRVFVTGDVEESSDMDKRGLSGKILIYPISYEPQVLCDRKKMNIHMESHKVETSDDFAEKYKHFETVKNLISTPENITGGDKAVPLGVMSFKIDPSGITTLKVEYSTFNGVESGYVLARQAFYYLKYAVHLHKHHVLIQDSLTTITPIYTTEVDGNRETALRLLCQLKRELTYIKRSQATEKEKNPKTNPLGIIAYMQSLLIALRNIEWLSKEDYFTEKARLQNLKSSFTASNTFNSVTTEVEERSKVKAKTWLGFIIISIFGFINTGIALSKSKTDGLFTHLSGLESPHLIPIYYLIVVLSVYFFIKYLYSVKQNGKILENIYNQKYWQYIVKAILAGLVVGVLVFIRLVYLANN